MILLIVGLFAMQILNRPIRKIFEKEYDAILMILNPNPSKTIAVLINNRRGQTL